jgi:hypothetical protein
MMGRGMGERDGVEQATKIKTSKKERKKRMKEEMKPVKSNQKEIGKVKVPVFENLKEAVAALKEEKCVSLINRQNASDIANEFRAAHTRPTSDAVKLAKLAKTDPALEKQIKDLLNKYSAADAAAEADQRAPEAKEAAK